MSAEWKKWYRDQPGNENKTEAEVDAALAARAVSQKKEQAAKKPAKPAEAPEETRAERAARMREAGKATPSITQEDVTKQKKRRTGTSATKPPPAGTTARTEWERDKLLRERAASGQSGQGAALGKRAKSGGSQ